MPVYVDQAQNSYRRMKMCHMLADSLNELHAMADTIGIQRKWFQISRSGVPHYDICQSKKKLALAHGAKEISRTEVAHLLTRKPWGAQPAVSGE